MSAISRLALTTATLGNTQRFAQIFDDTGRRMHRRYRASNNTTNIWSVAYGYDADDNISSITDLVDATRSLAFQYDGVDCSCRLATDPSRFDPQSRTSLTRRTSPVATFSLASFSKRRA